ncbi:MAG: hypothetical protein LBE84_06200 [Planctomycetota bacterium]|jgi:hypothetical protein|nr:hypothetical protein [Planctomycetota bacterium]
MAENWRIPRRTRICARSGQALDLTKPFFSALIERNDSFERLDFSIEAWPEVEKESFHSYWRNKGEDEKPNRRFPIDFERLRTFFDSLEGTEGRERSLLRYVLALILARRRKLRLDGMARTPNGDRLLLHDGRNGGRDLEVFAPEATREELEKAQEKLNQLFDCDFEDAEFIA